MADNVYNLKFTLSNGDVIDAGQITAPQGPKGDKGDSADIPYSSSTPFMDGVGSVGSENTVARGDHRHPSDTSRQEKLVSGTNIKTINGQSVLGSGDIPISGGSEYANTSEIVNNAITLTSTSTLADLATQILAQKTKVVRAPWDDNLKRILPSTELKETHYVMFKVFSIGSETDTPSAATAIQCLSLMRTALSGIYQLYEGYIYSMPGNSYVFTGWQGTGEEGAYPIGSIYMSTNSFPPSSLFGGTWEQIKDVFLLAAGDTYTAGSTGGEATHTLTLSEMPSHSHTFPTAAGKIYNEGGATMRGSVESSDYIDKSTSGVGGDVAHNNMPPYIAVYMWKRIA